MNATLNKRNLPAAVLALTALPLLTGCSRYLYTFAYKNADTFAVSKVDDYLDLDSNQEDRVKAIIRKHHVWHRKSELPRYLRFLDQLKGATRDGLNASELDWAVENVNGFLRVAYEHTSEDTARVLADLSDAQIDHLRGEMLKSNYKYYSLLKLSPEERGKTQADRLIDSLDDWVGDFSEAQKEQIREFYKQMPDGTRGYLRYRLIRQAQFINLLRAKPGEAAIKAKLEVWLVNREQNMPAYYKPSYDRWRVSFKKLLLDIDGILTPEQRRTLARRFDGLKDDFWPLVN